MVGSDLKLRPEGSSKYSSGKETGNCSRRRKQLKQRLRGGFAENTCSECLGPKGEQDGVRAGTGCGIWGS